MVGAQTERPSPRILTSTIDQAQGRPDRAKLKPTRRAFLPKLSLASTVPSDPALARGPLHAASHVRLASCCVRARVRIAPSAGGPIPRESPAGDQAFPARPASEVPGTSSPGAPGTSCRGPTTLGGPAMGAPAEHHTAQLQLEAQSGFAIQAGESRAEVPSTRDVTRHEYLTRQ